MLRSWKFWFLVVLVAAVTVDFVVFRSELMARNRPVVINNIAAPPLPTLVPAWVKSGETVYTQYCGACHGANLEGQPDWKTPLSDGFFPAPPHDSSSHTWHHTDELLLEIIANGNNRMPPFQAILSDEEMMAVLEYIKSHWGREERERQWWMTTVGDQQ